MPELPPLLRDQRKIDADHLRLLAIFHFVIAGLALFGLLFLFLHFIMMHALFSNPQMWQNQKENMPFPPAEFFRLFRWFYGFMGGMLVIGGVLNLLSGLFISRRENRTFSLVIAALDLLQIPFGTVLGIFTIVVLLRDSVRELYETQSAVSPNRG